MVAAYDHLLGMAFKAWRGGWQASSLEMTIRVSLPRSSCSPRARGALDDLGVDSRLPYPMMTSADWLISC